jgi:large subunit ribosomal protein L11
MKKKVKALVRLLIPGGGATPAPPVGSMLGQHQINLMDFCKKFNSLTADKKGQKVSTVVHILEGKKFEVVIKTPPTTDLIKKKIGLEKGSSRPNEEKVGKISWGAIEEIAQIKMPDLNVIDIEQAKKVVAGSAKSMGIEVVD